MLLFTLFEEPLLFIVVFKEGAGVRTMMYTRVDLLPIVYHCEFNKTFGSLLKIESTTHLVGCSNGCMKYYM